MFITQRGGGEALTCPSVTWHREMGNLNKCWRDYSLIWFVEFNAQPNRKPQNKEVIFVNRQKLWSLAQK